MRLLAGLIVAPQRGYDEPAILSYEISSFCPTSADGLQSAHHYGGRDFDACGSARKLNLFKEQFRDRISTVAKSGDAPHGWQHVAEELDTFAMQLCGYQRDAGDVSARATEARH